MQRRGDKCLLELAFPAVKPAMGPIAARDCAEVPKALAALLSRLTVALAFLVVIALSEAARCGGLSWLEVRGGREALALAGCFGSCFSLSSSAAATAAAASSAAAFFEIGQLLKCGAQLVLRGFGFGLSGSAFLGSGFSSRLWAWTF